MRTPTLFLGAMVLCLFSLSTNLGAAQYQSNELQVKFNVLLETMDRNLRTRSAIDQFSTILEEYNASMAKILNEPISREERNRKSMELSEQFFPRFLSLCNSNEDCRRAWSNHENPERNLNKAKNFWDLLSVMYMTLKSESAKAEYKALYEGEFADESRKIQTAYHGTSEEEVQLFELQRRFFDRFLKICNSDAACREAWANSPH